MFAYSSTSVTLKEETLLYPFESFLAEFGGSLGLFLGLSFLSLWEFFIDGLKCLGIFFSDSIKVA